MDRYLAVNLTISLTVRVGEEQTLDEVMQEMDYSFTASPLHNASIEDTDITDWSQVPTRMKQNDTQTNSTRIRLR